MSTYKLTYFNFRARGELSRFVLVQAGVQFEDKRVEYKDWPELKSRKPFYFCYYLEGAVANILLCNKVVP